MLIDGKHIRVSIDEQRLQLLDGADILMDTLVATASNGPGGWSRMILKNLITLSLWIGRTLIT